MEVEHFTCFYLCTSHVWNYVVDVEDNTHHHQQTRELWWKSAAEFEKAQLFLRHLLILSDSWRLWKAQNVWRAYYHVCLQAYIVQKVVQWEQHHQALWWCIKPFVVSSTFFNAYNRTPMPIMLDPSDESTRSSCVICWNPLWKFLGDYEGHVPFGISFNYHVGDVAGYLWLSNWNSGLFLHGIVVSQDLLNQRGKGKSLFRVLISDCMHQAFTCASTSGRIMTSSTTSIIIKQKSIPILQSISSMWFQIQFWIRCLTFYQWKVVTLSEM